MRWRIAVIKVENLTKAFGPKLAVNDVSFNVARGEVLGEALNDILQSIRNS